MAPYIRALAIHEILGYAWAHCISVQVHPKRTDKEELGEFDVSVDLVKVHIVRVELKERIERHVLGELQERSSWHTTTASCQP